jgi:hypothetical protein
MGYSYGYNYRSGKYNLLVCDGCGKTTADGVKAVRKRTCPHKVLTDSHNNGHRYPLPYCYPSALCSGCYATHKATLHATCAEGAATSNAEADAIEAALDAGELFVSCAFGDWADGVPAGKSLVTFTGRGGANKINVLIDAADYAPGSKKKLSDYPTAELVNA